MSQAGHGSDNVWPFHFTRGGSNCLNLPQMVLTALSSGRDLHWGQPNPLDFAHPRQSQQQWMTVELLCCNCVPGIYGARQCLVMAGRT